MAVSKEGNIQSLLSKYTYSSVTQSEMKEVITNYPSLSYNLKPFVFNDGTSKELLNLSGTIPVDYKSNRYYFPITIWIMDTYPKSAPLVYVTPTKDMIIKVSMYVDHNGRIYLPYLHDWRPNDSDLLSLIQVLILTFGDCPPLYSKPKETTTPYPVKPYMPTPGGDSSPYPINMKSGGSTANTSSGILPYPTASNMGGSTNIPVPGGYNSNYEAHGIHGSNTITEEHIKESYITALRHKLRCRIDEKRSQYEAEIRNLERTKEELMAGSKKLDAIITRLERDEIELQKYIDILRNKEKELEKSLETLENSDEIDPDEAVITTAPLYKQLLNTYAEEAATEDAIYYLGEALRGNVIDLETFLKHVRQLARKQFMLRAIMQKCRQKAGLAG